MSNQWFVRDNGKNIGPMTADDVKQQALTGAIRPETPIRNGADGNWFRADKIPGLFGDPSDAENVGTTRVVPSSTPPAAAPRVPSARPAEPVDVAPPMAEPADPFDFDAVGGGASSPMARRKPITRKKPASAAKPLSIVGGVIGFVVAYALSHGAVQGLFSGSIESQLKATAAELNKKLPMQVDEVTRCERVEGGPGKTFTYIYSVTVMDIPPEGKAALQQFATSQVLASPEMKPALDAGVTVRYRYFNPAGTPIFEFSVNR